MSERTLTVLANIVKWHFDEAGDLIAELSEATAHDPAALELTTRLAYWLGRFQVEVGDLVPGYETKSNVFH